MPDLPPSRMERIARAVGYFIVGLSGVAMILHTPIAVLNAVLSTITVLLSMFLASGFIAAVAAWRYKYMTEYVCLALIGTGVLVVTIAMYAFSFTHDYTGIVLALLLTYLLAKITARFAALNRLVRAHKRGD